jgi:hypothetical protein
MYLDSISRNNQYCNVYEDRHILTPQHDPRRKELRDGWRIQATLYTLEHVNLQVGVVT